MRRSILLPTVLAGCVVLVACGKKETLPPETASLPPPPPPVSQPPAAAKEEAPIDFSFSRNPTTSPTGTNATVPSLTPARSSVQVSDSGGKLETPEIYFQPPPFYPLSQRMQGIEGRVDIGVLLDESGSIVRAEVLAATAPQFSAYALEAVQQWKFGQARKEGKPVGTAVTLKIPFYSEYASLEMPARSPLAKFIYFEGSYYTHDENNKLVLANAPVTQLLPIVPLAPTNPVAGKTYRTKVAFTVTPEGQSINPTISSTNDPEFGQNVLTAIRFWQWIPALKNGKAQETRAEKEFTFTK